MRLVIHASLYVALGSLAVGTPASAKVAAKALVGDAMRVAIAGKLERAIGLHQRAGNWPLPIGKVEFTRAELTDETSNTHEKWVLPIDETTRDGKTLPLDSTRFVAAHSYSVGLYAGDALVESGVVYLYSGPRHGAVSRVDFRGKEEAASTGIATIPKGSL